MLIPTLFILISLIVAHDSVQTPVRESLGRKAKNKGKQKQVEDKTPASIMPSSSRAGLKLAWEKKVEKGDYERTTRYKKSGAIFYQPPSQEEVNKLSVWELAGIKPSGKSRQYNKRFANHPNIARLDPKTMRTDKLAEEFLKLRPETTEGPHKKLTSAIKTYLKDQKVDQPSIDSILGHQNRVRRQLAYYQGRFKKQGASNDAESAQCQKELVEKRRRAMLGPATTIKKKSKAKKFQQTFTDLMNKYEIGNGLDAFQIENRSRVFLKKDTHIPTSTKMLKSYLYSKGFQDTEVNQALARRVIHNISNYRKLDNKRRFDRLRAEKADHQQVISPLEELVEAGPSQPLDDHSPQSSLIKAVQSPSLEDQVKGDEITGKEFAEAGWWDRLYPLNQ